MKLSDLNRERISEAITSFYDTTSGHVAWLARTVGNATASVPRVPRKMGTYQFAYFFAADIDMLARYALGGVPMSGKYVKELCTSVESALFLSAAARDEGEEPKPPKAFYDTTLGFVVLACRARAALQRDGGPKLTPDQVRVLADRSDKVLKKAGLLDRAGDDVDAVRSFLEKEGQPV